MADPILLSPHDRSLTQGGAGDLSLYGVQADPVVVVAAADPEAPATDPLGASGAGAETQSAPSGGRRPDVDLGEGTAGALATPVDAITAPTIIPATPAPIAPADDLAVAGVSNGPAGSATSPAILAAPDQAPEPADDLAVAQPAAAMGATAMAPVDAAGLVSVPMPVVQALMGALGDGAGDPAGAIDRIDDVSIIADGAATNAIAALTDTVAAGTAATAEAVTAATTGVADAVEATVGTAAGLTTALGAAANEATLGVAAAASGPIMTVAPAASAAVDDALDLLGPDPAGGVATLVSLVTAADMFELSDAAPDGGGVVVAADDLLDSLVGDDTPLPGALLGDAESGGGDALVPLPDDLPFG